MAGENPAVSPQVGNPVMYTAPDASKWAAIVTKVWVDGSVNLMLFPPDGGPAIAKENVAASSIQNRALYGVQLIDQTTQEPVWISVDNGVLSQT